MNKLTIILYHRFVHLCFLLISLFISSCSDSPQQPVIAKGKDTIKPPVTIVVKNPVVIGLDTCPPPRQIAIPKKLRTSYAIKTESGTKTVQLLPPETNSAGFFVPMQNYNTEHGLALSSVVSSCMDKSGNLWFGTWSGGVSRYDGKSFTNYSEAQGLARDVVINIMEDNNGNLWFGTWGGGVSRYDGKSFTNYTKAHGLASDIVASTLEDNNGNLWFGTAGGVSRLNRDSKYLAPGKATFTNYTTSNGLTNNFIGCILEDKIGNFWFGTGESGVSRYDGSSFTNYTISDGLSNNKINCMLEDKNGSLWFGSDGGVSRLDGIGKSTADGRASFINYTTADGLAANSVWSMLEDGEGNLWFGTGGGGVSCLERRATSHSGKVSFINFTTTEGLANNLVNCIVKDKSGNLWFGTDGGGISRLDENWKSFTSLTTNQEPFKYKVFAILEDKRGNFWFGTGGDGIYRLNGNGKSLPSNGKTSFIHYTTGQGLAHNDVVGIREDKSGNIWICTKAGLSRYHANSFTTYGTDQGLANNEVLDIMEDKSGNLWICTSQALSMLSLDGKSVTTYSTVQGHNIGNMLEDKYGNIWLSTDEGASRLDRDRKFLTTYTTAQGLVDNVVTGMIEDKAGNLWFSTDRGVSRYDGKSFTSFTTDQGLPDDKVSNLAIDKKGIIWMGTKKGLTALKGFVLDVNQSFNHASETNLEPSNNFSNNDLEAKKFQPVFETYNDKTGYSVKDMTSQMYVTGENTLLAGTSEKLVRFDYSSIHKIANLPNAFIQGIKINNEAVCWYDLESSGFKAQGSKLKDNPGIPANIVEEVTIFGKALNQAQRDSMRKKFSGLKFDSMTRFYPVPINLVVPYRHNNVTFEFAAIEPARPQFVHYQYMLEGYDKDWNPLTDKTSASFGNIREGKYTFKLKAQSPEGVWSNPLSYTFKVMPPWYRTWWAYTFYGLCFLTAVFAIDRVQRRRLIAKERARAREREFAQAKEIEKAYNELKTTQVQLIQSEKMASLGELTAGIAHEIQNPLNFVNNFSEVNKELLDEMENELKAGNKEEAISIAKNIRENENKIIHHGKRADAIVKGMLQHSRSSSSAKEPTDINKLADEYLRLAYHGFRAKDQSFSVTLKTEYDENIRNINIIPQDIGRVLLNLYNNAFYAVAEKRQQSEGYEPTVSVSTKKSTDKIEFRVNDNGSGIPQKVLDKIFQPFFTTKPAGQGTGLGLSLAYDIVKAHGGELRVESKEGEGAEFTIQLPG